MAKTNISAFLLISIVVSFALSSCNGGSTSNGPKNTIDGWCITKADATAEDMQKAIDFGCSKVDCGPIKPSGPCFQPDTVRDHCSWVLDRFYKNWGVCLTDLGFFTRTDPSHGSCQYPTHGGELVD